MRLLYKISFLTLLLLSLSGCASMLSMFGMGGVVETNYTAVRPVEELKTIGRFSTKVQDAVQIKGRARKLKGLSSFAVPFYRIKYLQKDSTSENKGTYQGQGDAGKAKNVLRSELKGVDTAVYDAITREAYADFIARLHAKGIQVVDHRNMASYKKYKAAVQDPELDDKVYVDMPPWATYAETGRLSDPLAKIMRKEKTNVLAVDLDVSFMLVNHNYKRFSLAAKETLYNSQGVNVLGSLRALPTSGTHISMAMGQRTWSDVPFGYVEDVKSTGNRIGSMVATGLLMVSGGGRANWKDQVVYVTDQQAYAYAVREAVLQANERLAQALLEKL